jgi:hypothetical protein
MVRGLLKKVFNVGPLKRRDWPPLKILQKIRRLIFANFSSSFF